MRYQINRDGKPVAKFALKPDAVRMAKALNARKSVASVVILDKRVGETVTF